MNQRRFAVAATLAAAAGLLVAAGLTLRAADLDPKVVAAEKQRIAAIEKAQPSVVAVVTGGGSGVLISEDGFALTNFHVV
jgi:hypothetical protein